MNNVVLGKPIENRRKQINTDKIPKTESQEKLVRNLKQLYLVNWRYKNSSVCTWKKLRVFFSKQSKVACFVLERYKFPINGTMTNIITNFNRSSKIWCCDIWM